METYNPHDLLFSRNPKISLGDVRGWLERQNRGDATVKKELIKFIDHRLRRRYLTPLSKVPDGFRSGFLMMASACLLIETLQAFREGTNQSEDGSEEAFNRFFEQNEKYFLGLRVSFPFIPKKNKRGEVVRDNQGNIIPKCTFYKHIRCGILHQAETTGHYSVVRDESSLFDADEMTVNADKFLEQLGQCLHNYIADLEKDDISSGVWTSAVTKLKCICDNFEHGEVVEVT